MYKRDFNFTLPKHLIAQTPLEKRDRSRLLCMNRTTGALEHKHFFELTKLLRPGDCLVLNDSRVLPARLIGKRETGGAIEVLLLREVENPSLSHLHPSPSPQPPTNNLWECLVRPGKRIKEGAKLIFGDGELTATVKSELKNGNRHIKFLHDGIFLEKLEKLGTMPLPPYIIEALEEPERYQTVYSHQVGSAGAPTAGLHFTHELLSQISSCGVDICFITLHVGLGTFRPVKTEKIEDHIMHSEFYSMTNKTAEKINRAKEKGNRVIAVGTTTCRTLEAVAGENGFIKSTSGHTDIFIYPGYTFRCVDGLITNFHLPESTLIMLVSAFAGRKKTLHAYEEAIKKEYRFYSFGDAMFIG